MSESSPNINNPEQVLELASAIASRVGQNSLIAQKIMANLQGESFESPSPEQLVNAHIGRTAVYLSKVENPDSQGNWGEALCAELPLPDDSLSPEEQQKTRDIQLSFFDALRQDDDSILSDKSQQAKFLRTFHAVTIFAKENEISISSVYSDDELYYAAYRSAFSINESADEAIAGVHMISESVITNMIGKTIFGDMLDNVGTEEKEAMLELLIQDQEIRERISSASNLQQETMRQYGTYLLTKIYGIEAMSKLPVSTKLELMPRMPLAPQVFDDL